MKYNVGDILIFVGDSMHFKKSNRYEISNISKFNTSSFALGKHGEMSISFIDHIYGCYFEYADMNFKHISNYRDEKLNELLK